MLRVQPRDREQQQSAIGRSIVYPYFLRFMSAIFVAIVSSRWRALAHCFISSAQSGRTNTGLLF